MTSRGKKRLLALFVLLVFAAGALAGAWAWRSHQREQRLAEHRAAGLEAYEAGDHAAALPHLGRYVGRVKDDREALLALADSRRRVPQPNGRHLTGAIQIAQAAVALDPEDLEPREMLLDLYRDTGRPTELGQTADAILQRRPGHRDAMAARVQALGAAGRPQDALAAADELVEAHADDLEAHELRIAAMLRADVPEEQVHAQLDELQQRFSGSLDAALVRADLLARSGRIADAADALFHAADAWDGQPAPYARLVELMDIVAVQLGVRGERELAAALFARAGELADRDTADPLATFHAAFRDWKLEDARVLFERLAPAIAEPAAADTHALGLAALAAVTDPDVPEAPAPRPLLAALEDRPGGAPWLALARAAEAIESADHAGALRLLEGVSTDDPDAGRAQRQVRDLLAGLAERALDGWPAAERAWSQLAASASWRRARGMLARSLLSRGEPLQAAQAVLIDPDIESWWGGLELLARGTVAAAEINLPEEDLDDALRLVESFAEAVPDNPVVKTWHARLLLVKGETAPAIEIARGLLEADLAGAASEAVALVSRLRQHDEAVAEALLARVRDSGQLDAEGAYRVAIALAGRGRVQEGRSHLEDAIAAAPEGARLDLRRALARYLDGVGHEDATAELLRLSADYPENASVQFDVLQARSSWERPERLSPVVDRLRLALGEDSQRWRIFDARTRLMVVESESEINSAILSLAQFLEAEGDSAEALSLMSRGYVMLADAAEAAGNYERAVRNRRRAADVLQRAIARQASPAGFPPLVAMLRDLGRTSEARAVLERFARIDDLPPALARVRAGLLEDLSMRELARLDRERLAASGESEDVLALALLRIAQGEQRPMEDEVRELLARDDLSETTRRRGAQYLARIGDADAGRALLDGLPEEVDGRPRAMLIARYLLGADRPGEAAEVLAGDERALRSPEAWLLLARARLGAGDRAAAERAIADGLERAPDDPRLLAMQSAISIDEQTPPLLQLAAAVRATEADNSEGAARLHELINRLLAGELTSEDFAIQLRGLTEQVPTLYPAWRLLMQAQLETAGDRNVAVQTAQRAARILPSDPRPARDAVRILLAADRTEDALGMARDWAQRDPTDADAAITAGRIALRLGRAQRALEWLEPRRERILDRAESQRGNLAAYAAALAATGDGRAFELMDRHLARGEPWPAVFIDAASSIQSAPARRRWLDRIEPAIERPEVRIALARSYHALSLATRDRADLERAIEIASAVAESGDSSFALLATIGELHQAAGDAEAAESAYRAALELEPDHPDVLNNLAYLIFDRGAAEEAIALARRAIDAAQELGHDRAKIALYYDTLGVALAATGRHADARQAFEAGLRLDAHVPDLLVGLAEAHAALEQPDRARESLRALGPLAALPPAIRARADELFRTLE